MVQYKETRPTIGDRGVLDRYTEEFNNFEKGCELLLRTRRYWYLKQAISSDIHSCWENIHLRSESIAIFVIDVFEAWNYTVHHCTCTLFSNYSTSLFFFLPHIAVQEHPRYNTLPPLFQFKGKWGEHFEQKERRLFFSCSRIRVLFPYPSVSFTRV